MSEVAMTSGFRFTEEVTPTLSISAELKSISFDQTSPFQRVQVSIGGAVISLLSGASSLYLVCFQTMCIDRDLEGCYDYSRREDLGLRW